MGNHPLMIRLQADGIMRRRFHRAKPVSERAKLMSGARRRSGKPKKSARPELQAIASSRHSIGKRNT